MESVVHAADADAVGVGVGDADGAGDAVGVAGAVGIVDAAGDAGAVGIADAAGDAGAVGIGVGVADAVAGVGAGEGAGVLQPMSARSVSARSVDLVMRGAERLPLRSTNARSERHFALLWHFASESHLNRGAQSGLASHALSATAPHAMS